MDPLWKQLESNVETLTKGQLTLASGRLKDKGDIHTPTLLIECKLRKHKHSEVFYSSHDWFDTCRVHAGDIEKTPIVVIGLYEEENTIYLIGIFCLKRDISLFSNRHNDVPIEIPDDWIPISEESLKAYCMKENSINSSYSKTRRRTSSWPSRPMGSRISNNDNKPDFPFL